MSNLFFRTNIAPYRIDTYNALHEQLGCEMHFYWKEETSQNLNMDTMLQQCKFTPQYLKGIRLFANSRKLCTNIWSILRKNKPEVVIVPEFQILTIQVLLYKWLFRKKFKVVSMCDDSYDMLTNDNDFSKIHKYARKFIAPKVDDILLVDNRAVEWYKENYGKGIWLPIIRDEEKEIPLYKDALEISNELNKKYQLCSKKVLLFVGRLVDVKNLDRMIEAVGKTKEDFTTVIIGDGHKMDELKKVAAKTEKEIIFAGHFENQEIRAWYNISDVMILPSKREPFGAVTNEALIAGNYCLVSKSAGSSCLIDDSNGDTFNPYDTDEMSLKIDRIFSEKVASKGNIIKLKENKMRIEFNDILTHVIDAINK